MPDTIIVLIGPTASGKSNLSIDLALQLRAREVPVEIVNADSMLVYRGMDIGTAKPNLADRKRVVHHLIDILEVNETASVADFQSLARQAIEKIQAKGAIPIIVGGSALYTRAIVDDFEFPGSDADIRAYWQNQLTELGSQRLHDILAEKDLRAAQAILPGNGRRIVRALEVIELTGQFKSQLPKWEYFLPGVKQFGLEIDREEMDSRIAARVYEMWDAGLVKEVEKLLKNGLANGLTASRALGYRQVLAMLNGEITEGEAIELTINATKRFARKQLGWFRRDKRIQWLKAGDSMNVRTIVETIS